VSKVTITQVKSTIGQTDRHLGRSAEHKDSPQLRGMLRQVNHLVRIESA
jgi:ribosomal protein L30/L7E